MKRLLILVFLVFPAILQQRHSRADEEEMENPLYGELVGKGIAIPAGPTIKLPTPLVRPGAAPADVMQLLDKAAGRVPVELFLRRSIQAPFSLTISIVDNKDGDRCGQEIDLKFIAYGKLDAVLESDFMKQFLSSRKKKDAEEKTTILEAEELKERGIQPLKARKLKEQFSTLTMSLLERVQVEGVTRSVRTNSPQYVLSAMQMDDRFQNDRQYPDIWRHIKILEDEEKLGPPHAYTGLAGYVLVTKVPAHEGALLIEMHFLMHEPHDWFGGPNLLRSKFPTVIQDNVRSFRRKLTKN